VVLDGPDRIEAELVGEPGLLERVVEDRGLDTRAEGAGRRQLEEDSELQGLLLRRSVLRAMSGSAVAGAYPLRTDQSDRSRTSR
jgi:hypothetical protein